jgi:hypothetical protein
MQPPQFIPISIPFQYVPGISTQDMIVSKDCRGGALGLVGCTPRAQVAFQVWSHWGISYWEVNYGKPQLSADEESNILNITGYNGTTAGLLCNFGFGPKLLSQEKCDRVAEIWGAARIGPASVSGNGGGANVVNVTVEFQMTTAEDHWDSPWVQARVFDIYGAGAQKTVKLKSTMEKLVDFLAAVANALVQAASALLRLVWDAIAWLAKAVVSPFASALKPAFSRLTNQLGFLYADVTGETREMAPLLQFNNRSFSDLLLAGIMYPLSTVILILTAIMVFVRIVVAVVTAGQSETIGAFIKSAIAPALLIAATSVAGSLLMQSWMIPGRGGGPLIDWLASLLPGGKDSFNSGTTSRGLLTAAAEVFAQVAMQYFGHIPLSPGFGLAITGFVMGLVGFAVAAGDLLHPSAIALEFSLLGFLMSAWGLYKWINEDSKVASAISDILAGVEGAIVFSAFLGSTVVLTHDLWEYVRIEVL